MVCGRLPFDAPKWTEVLIQHVTQAPPRVREVNADCPVWLERLIDRALSKSAAERPTMAAVRDAIRVGDGGELIVPAGAPQVSETGDTLAGETLPTPASAETLMEVKSPSNPTPLLSAGDPAELANAETMASTDPAVSAEANRKLMARGRRRMVVAAALGLGVGGIGLVGLFVGLGGAEGGANRRPSLPPVAATPDAGSGREPSTLLFDIAWQRSRLAYRQLALDELARIAEDIFAPHAVVHGGGHRPPDPDFVVRDAAPAPPAPYLDAYDIDVGIRPAFDAVRWCRNKYENDVDALKVKIVVRGDGYVEDVRVAPRHTGSGFHLCVLRAIRQDARFTAFTSERQEIAYDFAILPM
jgi:hypothetical protein